VTAIRSDQLEMKFITTCLLLPSFTLGAMSYCEEHSPHLVRGGGRTCFVANTSSLEGDNAIIYRGDSKSLLLLFWQDGRSRESCPKYHNVEDGVCRGQLGMNLSLQCRVPGSFLCRGDNCNITSGGVLNITNLQPQQAGEYQCRTNEELIMAFNLTVDTGENCQLSCEVFA